MKVIMLLQYQEGIISSKTGPAEAGRLKTLTYLAH